jgi:single-strand DNA-binding protein
VANFNRIILIGNLTRDPDYKQQPSGQGVCRLSLAANRQFKNKATGVLSQEVCYVDVSVWGPQAESCRQYLQKGRPVLVEGRLKFDSWKDAEGQQRQKHSIVADNIIFLGSGQRPDASAGEEGVSLGARMAPAVKSKDEGHEEGLADALFKEEAPFTDDLPF